MIGIRYKDSRGLWQLWKAMGMLLCVMLLLAPQPSRAATMEFTVLAVGIDDNSEKADILAMEYARKRAVFLAVKQMGIPAPGDAAAKISDEDLAQIVRGATITQTKRDKNKTFDEVKVSINDLPLRKALGMKDDAATGPANSEPAQMRPVLVLPAMVMPKKILVWEKDNPLRSPLSTELLRQGHGVIMLPGGDLQDLRLIDGENVMKVTMKELQPMFERYGTDEIIIVAYSPGTAGTDDADKVLLRRLNTIEPHDEALEIRPDRKEDDANARLARSAQAIASAIVQIANSTSQTQQQKLAAATKIPVHFIYSVPKEMAAMTDAIRGAPGVMQLDMPAIGLNNVTGTIYLNGDKTALHKELAAKGIVIRDQGNEWTVSVR